MSLKSEVADGKDKTREAFSHTLVNSHHHTSSISRLIQADSRRIVHEIALTLDEKVTCDNSHRVSISVWHDLQSAVSEVLGDATHSSLADNPQASACNFAAISDL